MQDSDFVLLHLMVYMVQLQLKILNDVTTYAPLNL
jgi:hypothetical protein